MGSADILFDELYDILMKNCFPNPFMKRIFDEIYFFVKEEIKKYTGKNNSKKNEKLSKFQIKYCQKNVCEIIKILEKTDEKREKFMRKFPYWKKCREENIQLLDKIASDLHDEKKIVNTVNTITSAVGLAGGAAILGSILFPPAAVVTIPAWLGGSAVAALLPSCVLSVVGTTTAATSTLAVTGGVACAVNGASKIVTSITELKLLKKHMDDAKAIISRDQIYFEDLKDLFIHTDNFSDALKQVLNFETLNCVLKDVFEFLELVKRLKKRFCGNFNHELKMLFQKYISRFNGFCLPFEYRIVFFGILFVSFLVYKNNCFLFNNVVGAYQIITGNLSLLNAFGALSTTSAVTSVKTAPKVLARNVRLFTGIGLALDTITILKCSIDMKAGSRNEHGKRIKDVSDKLKQELNAVEDVYKSLQYSMLHSIFLESQKPL